MFPLLLISLLTGTSPAWGSHVPNEVMVRFRADVSEHAAARALEALAIRQVDQIPALRTRLVKLPPGLTVERAIEQLKRNPAVELAEPNMIVRALAHGPNDPDLAKQWALDQIEATRAWNEDVPGAQGAASVTIAIVDSGISPAHEDMATKLVPGYNFTSTVSGDTFDRCNHGTQTAGIAAAATDNGTGIAGVAWKAKLMPLKVIDGPVAGDCTTIDCTGSEFLIIRAVVWAADHGADVINMSLGSCIPQADGSLSCASGTKPGRDAMKYAYERGVVLVAAAGNESTSQPSFPAAYPFVIGVSATTKGDTPASFSNFGNYIDVAAPGVEIYAPGNVSDTSYCSSAGTSVAAPFVAGLAAVLIGQDPSRSPSQIESLIKSTADDRGTAGWDPQFGYGRINMYRALTVNSAVYTTSVNVGPTERDLAYVYPNPFSPVLDGFANIVVKAGRGEPVKISIFDLQGNRVWSASLSASETQGRDLYYDPVRWTGVDEKGAELANGVYLVRVKVSSSDITKKLVIAR